MAWVNDFPDAGVKAIGALEVLAAIGLILPALLNIAPVLVPLAALGLVLLMAGAAITHFRRKENQMILVNAVPSLPPSLPGGGSAPTPSESPTLQPHDPKEGSMRVTVHDVEPAGPRDRALPATFLLGERRDSRSRLPKPFVASLCSGRYGAATNVGRRARTWNVTRPFLRCQRP